MTQHTITLDQLRGDIDPTWSPDEIARDIDRRRIQRSADLAAPPLASSCSPARRCSSGYLTEDFPGFAGLSTQDLRNRSSRKPIDAGRQWECTIDLTQQHTPKIDLDPIATTLNDEQLDELEQAIARARGSRATGH